LSPLLPPCFHHQLRVVLVGYVERVVVATAAALAKEQQHFIVGCTGAVAVDDTVAVRSSLNARMLPSRP
jgi:hypothetical protein